MISSARGRRRADLGLGLAVLFAAVPFAWGPSPASRPISSRIAPPKGYHRVHVASGSFGAWLRRLPLKPGRPPVRLYDGTLKRDQSAHYAVVDIDVGHRDLQQCADAVMRLRAEYQWASGHRDDLCFRFTSGARNPFSLWAKGVRPRVEKNRVRFVAGAARPDASYQSFRRWLDDVFIWSGTLSLSGELVPVRHPERVEVGDVFIHGGTPGHAEIVVDVAENDAGRRVFLLAQSYMPAQDIHVLVNPEPGSPSPWYVARAKGTLVTPEYTFEYTELRRFTRRGCAGR